MSITILKQTATTDKLESVGPVPVPLSTPACEISKLAVTISGKPDCATGLWESTVGKFQRQVKEGEVMHILTGKCTFTPEGQETPIEINAGDTVFFAENTNGVWDIQEPMRKVYVLV